VNSCNHLTYDFKKRVGITKRPIEGSRFLAIERLAEIESGKKSHPERVYIRFVKIGNHQRVDL
jgi:hypothetical protein